MAERDNNLTRLGRKVFTLVKNFNEYSTCIVRNIFKNFISAVVTLDYHDDIGKVWNKCGNVRRSYKILSASTVAEEDLKYAKLYLHEYE